MNITNSPTNIRVRTSPAPRQLQMIPAITILPCKYTNGSTAGVARPGAKRSPLLLYLLRRRPLTGDEREYNNGESIDVTLGVHETMGCDINLSRVALGIPSTLDSHLKYGLSCLVMPVAGRAPALPAVPRSQVADHPLPGASVWRAFGRRNDHTQRLF